MEAFGLYYDQFFTVMYREVRRLLRADESTALDIVHDAMLKAGRSMKVLPDHPSVQAWSIVVVRSVIYDWLRRRKRQRAAEASLRAAAERDLQPVSGEQGDRDAWEARERWLAEQLERLPSDLKQLVDFRYRLGWTLERIGQALGMRAGCVDGKLRRLIDELRAQAEEHTVDDC